ncbi:MAG: HK97 family phage prohead protease [Pseudomonadota bacterium]
MTRFAGYAALFDRVDRGGDVIRRGAFTGVAAPVPLYWQHDPRRPVGVVDSIAEDARGLRVIGRTHAPVAAGTGLSFGYRVKAARLGAVRELARLELVEVSLVRSPMQPLARVHAIEISQEN